jgi:ATP-dependent RNA helicase DDX20
MRTTDVVGDSLSFRELLLPEEVLTGLQNCGFSRPSPVQHAAIPLARLGVDLIVQAKAGTGKTLVFAVAAIEKVDRQSGVPQVGVHH